MTYLDAVEVLCDLRSQGLIADDVVSAIVDTHAQIANDALLNRHVQEVEQSRNRAYIERNKLVAALSKLFPSHLAQHGDDPNWEETWRTIVFVQLPTGQASWHIHDDERALFAHLSEGPNDWDGHSTDEKYARLSALEVQP